MEPRSGRWQGHPDGRQAGMGPAATSAPFTLPHVPWRSGRRRSNAPLSRPRRRRYFASWPRTAPAGNAAVWTLT